MEKICNNRENCLIKSKGHCTRLEAEFIVCKSGLGYPLSMKSH